jgi:uridine kinase
MLLPPEEPHFAPWRVASLEVFVQSIQNELADDKTGPGVVAIDGRSAGGKTTLATLLSHAVPGSMVVHTDDIPSSGNLPGRDTYSSPYVETATQRSFYDWTERLLENVLRPARAGQAVRYRPPAWEDWFREEGAIEVPLGCPMLILEGVGAARRELAHVLDAVVWVQSDIERAEERGITRDGGDADTVVCGTPDLEHDPAS